MNKFPYVVCLLQTNFRLWYYDRNIMFHLVQKDPMENEQKMSGAVFAAVLSRTVMFNLTL